VFFHVFFAIADYDKYFAAKLVFFIGKKNVSLDKILIP